MKLGLERMTIDEVNEKNSDLSKDRLLFLASVKLLLELPRNINKGYFKYKYILKLLIASTLLFITKT